MKRIRFGSAAALAIAVAMICAGTAAAQLNNGWMQPGVQAVKPNGYGLGTNSDQFGRPHQYRTGDGQAVDPIFQDGVKRDAYGLGVHRDQFGRPVYDGKATGSGFGND
jgi:hypothetical protein